MSINNLPIVNIARRTLLVLLLFSVLARPTSCSSSGTTAALLCDVDRDDIRLFGSGGDAGRVELCHASTWRYVCSQKWSLSIANVACRQLGYQSAFMANTAAAMAFGETVNSGVRVEDGGINIVQCQGDEQTLRECQLKLDSTSPCTIHEAVGVACSNATSNTAASTYPAALEGQVQSYIRDMASWYASEKERVQRQRLLQSSDDNDEEFLIDNPSFLLRGVPTPFHDTQAIREAFVFSDAVARTYEQIKADFNRSIMTHAAGPTMDLFQEDLLAKVRWNAFGIDLSDFFPAPMTLDQVKAVLHQSRFLEAVRDLYLSANQHNAIHWFLDAPYRYYSHPGEGLLPTDDPSSQNMFNALQRDGIVVIDDFGADIDALAHLAEAALTGDSLYRKNETSIAGGGSIITSRRPIPQLDDLLIHNQTLASVINAYLGPSILHGYKVTRLTKGLTTTDQYNAGMYHHDRVGRRLKLFLFLHDVDCEMGHPTKVAVGTQNILYYKSEDYPVTRFAGDHVEKNYEIVKGCGKRGGGFLFDTHTIHKGTVRGDRERTVIIAEYHHIAKCAYSKEYKLGIPCPGGDLYRADAPLTTMTT